VARPLGLATTFFLREGSAATAERRARHGFAATRRTPARGVIVGAVDDDNAFAMGGVGGHAGLFSTAEEVAALGQAWLDALAGRSRWLSAAIAARFAAREPGSERALGWDTPSQEGSSLGDRLGRGPRGAIGHLGFTGCSLWLDLDHGVACGLLTNHVHPDGPDKVRLKAFRARFHDTVAEALGI
jgi:serine-type D-Ala-D-Ala carboxypeptidase